MKTPLQLPRINHRLAWASAMALACHAALAAGNTTVNTPAAAAPETLGTLLFTPAQREQIIRARQPQTQTGEQAVATTSVSHLQGVVRRDGGNSTVWINGKALPQGQAQTPTLQGVDALVAGRRLRVGEAIDTLSGVRSDVVVPGTVTVTKPPSK